MIHRRVFAITKVILLVGSYMSTNGSLRSIRCIGVAHKLLYSFAEFSPRACVGLASLKRNVFSYVGIIVKANDLVETFRASCPIYLVFNWTTEYVIKEAYQTYIPKNGNQIVFYVCFVLCVLFSGDILSSSFIFAICKYFYHSLHFISGNRVIFFLPFCKDIQFLLSCKYFLYL